MTPTQRQAALEALDVLYDYAHAYADVSHQHQAIGDLIERRDLIRAALQAPEPEICPDCGSEMMLVCAGLDEFCKENAPRPEPEVDLGRVREILETIKNGTMHDEIYGVQPIGRGTMKDLADQALSLLPAAKKGGGG